MSNVIAFYLIISFSYMENILNNTSDSIWAVDTHYKILYLNDAFKISFKRAYGYELKEGDTIIDKLPFNISSIWQNRYQKALDGDSYSIDEDIKDINNNTLYIQVSFSPIKSGENITGVTCFGRDITKERLNELALKKYSILLKSSLESQKDTILLSVDKELNYMYFNSAHYEVMKYAYDNEVKIGMNILKCITDIEDRKAALDNYTRALNGESHSNIRVFGDVHKEYYESFFNPIRDDNDEIIGATALARNITKRMQQEEALRIANITKDKFFSIISHDLRSPISSITSLANVIYNDFDNYSETELKSSLNIICKGLDLTFNLLENLLLWSRTQTNSIVFKPVKIDLSVICNNILDILSQNIKSKELTINRKYSESFVINADQQMISTVIRNLLSNAIKFSHKKGHVEIGFDRFIDENSHKIQIYVRDEGVGISKDVISRLFNIGENISTQGTQKEVGTGLGLIICKEFVDWHQGDIFIDSEINKGTKISIELPQ